MKKRILDLFCGAGGAAMGYHRAGFEVVGVDIEPQPNYPFTFIRFDALDFLRTEVGYIRELAALHASPPCQRYSNVTGSSGDRTSHPDLLGPTRELLMAQGRPYVIENVQGARRFMVDPVRLCGSSFGLDLHRHRYFESNWGLVGKPCDHGWQTPRFRSLRLDYHRAGKLSSVVGVHGNVNYKGEFPLRCRAMGIDWMTNAELVESIPPAYTEYIGGQLMEHLG